MDQREDSMSDRSIQILPYVDGPIQKRSLTEKLGLSSVFGTRCGRIALQVTFILFLLILALVISATQPEVLDQLDYTIWEHSFFEGRYNNSGLSSNATSMISCEKIHEGSVIAQPVNAVSSVAYAFAGLVMIGFAIADSVADGKRNIEDSLLLRRPIWSFMLGFSTLLLFATGFLFHASFTALAFRLDLMAWWLLAATFILFTFFRLFSSLFVVESDVVTFDKQEASDAIREIGGGLSFVRDDDTQSVISDIRRVSVRSSRRILQEGSNRGFLEELRDLEADRQHELELQEAERQVRGETTDEARGQVHTSVRYDPGCVWNCCGVRASCRVGGICAGFVADVVALGSVGGAGLGVFLFGTFVEYELREESIFVLFTFMFLSLTSAHWCFHRRIVTYSWSVLGTGVFLFAFGFIFNFYESSPAICNPASLFQTHALWHFLSAIAILVVYLFFRGDALAPPNPYQETSEEGGSGRVLVALRRHSGLRDTASLPSVRSGELDMMSVGSSSVGVRRQVTSLRRVKQRQHTRLELQSAGASTLSSASVGHDRVQRFDSRTQEDPVRVGRGSDAGSRAARDSMASSQGSRERGSISGSLPATREQPQTSARRSVASAASSTNETAANLPPVVAVAIPDQDLNDNLSVAESSVASEPRPPSLPVIMEYRNDSGGHLLSMVRRNQDLQVVNGQVETHERARSTDGRRLGEMASRLVRRRTEEDSDSDSESDGSEDELRSPPPATANRDRYEGKYSDVSTLRRQQLAKKAAARLGDCTLCGMPVHEQEQARDANENLFHGGCLKCFTCFLDLTDSEHVIDSAADGSPEIYCLEHGRDRSSRRQNSLIRGSTAASLSHRDSSRLSMSVRARREEIQERLRMSAAEAPTCSKCGGELLNGKDIVVSGMERYHKVCPDSTTLYRVPRYFARRAPQVIAVTFSCSSKNKKTYTFLFALDSSTKERALKENRMDPVILGYEPDIGARAKVKRKIAVPHRNDEAFRFTEQSGTFRSLGGKQSAPEYHSTSKNVVGTLFHMEGGVMQKLTVWIRYSRESKTAEAVSATLDIRLTPQKVGATVSAKVAGWRQYYKGTIHAANEDGSYDILFDDGEYVQGVLEHQIRAELRR